MPIHPGIQGLADSIGELDPDTIAVADMVEEAVLTEVRDTLGVELDTPELVDAFIAGGVYVLGCYETDPVGQMAGIGKSLGVAAIGAMVSRRLWMEESIDGTR